MGDRVVMKTDPESPVKAAVVKIAETRAERHHREMRQGIRVPVQDGDMRSWQ